MNFDKIVKKMLKKSGKVLLKDDFWEYVDPEKKPEYQTRLNKLIYKLRSEGYIISLKAGVYIVPRLEDKSNREIDLLDEYYFALLKRYIRYYVGGMYYISGWKSLGFHMKDMSVPERIYIMNRNINKKIQLGDREIIFKTISGKKQGKKLNLFSHLYKYHSSFHIEGLEFKVSCLELSLLESCIVEDIYAGVDIQLIIRAIKKYKKYLNYEVFQEVGEYKYNMAFNRLKEIAKPIDSELYKLCLDVIKKNGGCFVGEGLRNM